MPPLNNPQHEAFARLVAQGRSKREAAEEAGYSKARASAQGCNLAKDSKIAQRIAELQTVVADKVTTHAALNREWVLEKLRENVERALQVTPVLDNEGKPTGEYRYEGNVVNRGLELIGKTFGMFEANQQPETAPVDKVVYEWRAPKPEPDEESFPNSASDIQQQTEARVQ